MIFIAVLLVLFETKFSEVITYPEGTANYAKLLLKHTKFIFKTAFPISHCVENVAVLLYFVFIDA